MLLDTASDIVSSEVSPTVEQTVEETVEKVTTFWDNIWSWLGANWPKFLICAIVLVGGWFAVRIIISLMRRGMKRAGAEKSVITFVTSVLKYLLRFFVIIFSLSPFGLSLGSVMAALGAAGLGLGLGLKETVSNVASGVQIILTKPFSVGHYIAINNVEGTVQRVEIMFTTLKTLESQEVVIPNATLTAGTLTNYTSLGIRRAQFNFNLQYGADLNRVRELLLKIASENEMVRDDPPPMFVVLGQTADGISCSLRVFAAPEDYWLVFWGINEQISNVFRDENIRIPFSQLDVHIQPTNPPTNEDVSPKKSEENRNNK